MPKCFHYILFLFWFSFAIISYNILFHSGFLLTKTALEQNGSCSKFDTLYTTGEKGFPRTWDEEDFSMCSKQKARVLLLVIDAFRYDFGLYDEGISNPLPYENKMPIITSLRKSNPESTRLYKFVADPPTTTMQRLKALTTGSLPTFIDAGSNFASTAIKEDNLISQVVSNDKKIVFMGDDTWISLYPNHFIRQYPFPSFNVMDLDTVDNGVSEHIYNELKQNDWDLLIGHYLGVDHCGHKYGPNHPEMARKLTEMNDVISKLADELPEDVMLVVIGDHGMTATGDHGGESDMEILSTLFVHSKFPLMKQQETDFDNTTELDSVNQVDLIPTLATILGVPIPYSNVGSLILDILPVYSWLEVTVALWMNVKQITNYVMHYSKISNVFNSDHLKQLELSYEQLGSLRLIVDDKNFENFWTQALKYVGDTRAMCRDVWVEFNPYLIARGLLLLAIVSVFAYNVIDGVKKSFYNFAKNISYTLYGTTFLSILIAYLAQVLGIVNEFFTTFIFISGFIACFVFPVFLCFHWEDITENWGERKKERGPDDLLSRCIIALSIFAFFSNSYVIHESYVTYYLLNASIFIMLIDGGLAMRRKSKLQKTKSKKKVFLILFVMVMAFLLISRISFYFWQCREEHNCDYANEKQVDSSNWILSVLSIVIVITLARVWLNYCGNLTHLINPVVIFFRYSTPILVFSISAFWAVNSFPRHSFIKNLPHWGIDGFALASYAIIIFGIIIIHLYPNTIFIFYFSNPTNDDTIAHVFQSVKNMFGGTEKYVQKIPMAWGLGTAYSAPFIMITTLLTLLVALLLGITSAPSALMLFVSLFIILGVSSIVRHEKSTTIEQMLEVPSSLLASWVLLASYYFYATGHQASFPNIPWTAAFVGSSEKLNNNFLPAMLIIIHVFGSYILTGFTVPLLQLAPLAFYNTFPNLESKIAGLKKGEMFVYESHDFLFANTTKLCIKYLVFHAVRLFAAMLSCTIHCRHLMVWKIFTPRLIFESVAMFVTVISVLLGYLFYVRVVKTVSKIVLGLQKQSR